MRMKWGGDEKWEIMTREGVDFTGVSSLMTQSTLKN